MRISISATCYNHERYIPAFMESVLAQTYTNWELVVVDDCSGDGSFALLQEYAEKDPRIRVYQNDRNRHVCHTGNRAESLATGELITLMSCDDMLAPDALEYNVAFLATHPQIGALYTEMLLVQGEIKTDEVIRMPDRFDRMWLLRQELFGRNCLCTPGLTIRKGVLQEIGCYNQLLRMTQDHELHIRILERYEVARAERPTVYYRRHEENLSDRNEDYFNALMNEGICFLSDHYLSGIRSVADLLEICPECRRYGEPVAEAIPFFVARYAFDAGVEPEVRVAGYIALYRFLSDEKNRKMVESRYDFLAKDFMKLADHQIFGSLKALERAQANLNSTLNSVSYKLGLMLTLPLRFFYRIIRPREEVV